MIAAACILGLLNSLHCLAMCGPLHMAALNMHANRWVQSIAYHTSRTLVYTAMGFVCGLFGVGLNLAGLQQPIAIISGSIIILLAITGTSRLEKWLYVPFRKLFGKHLGTVYALPFSIRMYVAGAINGLLPCGLVYLALLGSMAMPSYWGSALFMCVFGISTWPVFSLTAMLPKRLTQIASVQYATKAAIMVLGVWVIVRGMGLGIPYVSPAIQHETSADMMCAPH